MTAEKQAFLSDMLARLIPAYREGGQMDGSEYYENIILEDLTSQEYQWLIEAANGKFSLDHSKNRGKK